MTSERNTNNDVRQSHQPSQLSRRIKSVLKPGWEFLRETPDQHIGWSRQAASAGIAMCESQGFDAVYTTGPPHSTHLAGLKIHRHTDLPWIADFRDPWARRPWTKSRNPIGQKCLPYFERKVVEEASCVILNNDTARLDFQTAYPWIASDKFVSIPNGFDPDLLAQANRLADENRLRTGPSPTLPLLCHPGTLYGRRDPQPLLEAIAQLAHHGTAVRFQQIGYANPAFNLDQMAARLGIGHLVETVPPVAHQDVLRLMSNASALLVVQPDGPLMVPGKVYEMLIFDSPIVAVCDSVATNAVLSQAGRAWTAASRDIDAIAVAIKNSLRSSFDHESCMLRQKARQTYDGKYLTRQLSEVIRAAVCQTCLPSGAR